LEKLAKHAPRLVKQLRDDPMSHDWDVRLERLQGAWNWSRAESWLRQHIERQPEADALATVHRLRDEIGELTAQTAALQAWRHFFARLTDSQREHLIAWQQAMRRVGKGT